GLVLYASLLAVPLLAVVLDGAALPADPAPPWTAGGVLAGWALWRARRALSSSDAAPVWAGAPGWGGFVRLMTLVTFIVAAEEAVWRGFLVPRLGVGPAALAFAAHHFAFGPRHVAFTFAAGLAWGGLFVGSGSLVPPAASHLVYNALAWRHLRAAAHQPGGR
ncbi:MAG: CPBP family intramembrane glutamic endopeptidase, partial [Gemmataceae bacterium]